MNRRDFLKGVGLTPAAAALPSLRLPEERIIRLPGDSIGDILWSALGPYIFASLHTGLIDDEGTGLDSEVRYPGYRRVMIPRTSDEWERGGDANVWKMSNKKTIKFVEISEKMEGGFWIGWFGLSDGPKSPLLFSAALDGRFLVDAVRNQTTLTLQFLPGQMAMQIEEVM